ncbi:MAG: hypothetical protein KDI38_00970 [Calditrichaeota bacterium]|nr:hypothetical protein [Calditrichota bacterium]
MATNTITEKLCRHNHFKRLNYFHGMLLDDLDFYTEQKYHHDKRRMLNRYLHGWGIVCGLEIGFKFDNAPMLYVNPGLAIDCEGNEIYVPEKHEFDLQTILGPTPSDKAYYITISYQKRMTDPVPVYAPGDCEDRESKPSRWTEGYCIQAFNEKPDLILLSEDCQSPAGLKAFCNKKHLCCPDTCEGPHHLILGKITIDGKIYETERRYVFSTRILQNLIFAIQGEFVLPDANPISIICWLIDYISSAISSAAQAQSAYSQANPASPPAEDTAKAAAPKKKQGKKD